MRSTSAATKTFRVKLARKVNPRTATAPIATFGIKHAGMPAIGAVYTVPPKDRRQKTAKQDDANEESEASTDVAAHIVSPFFFNVA